MKLISGTFLLAILGMLVFVGLQVANSGGIRAGSTCYASESGNIKLGPFGFHKDAIKDEGCAQVESARLFAELGQDDHAKFVTCSHEGAIQAFGSRENCLEYHGSYQKIMVDVTEKEVYCKRKSKKLLRKITFQSKRYFKKCMGK